MKPSKSRIVEENRRDSTTFGERVETQKEMFEEEINKDKTPIKLECKGHSKYPSSETDVKEDAEDYDVEFWEPKPPKVLMEDSDAVPLELRAQIQLYATTE